MILKRMNPMSDLTVLAPQHLSAENVAKVHTLCPSQPASDLTLRFLQSLSQTLLNDAKCKAFSELIALGFWLRSSNIKQMIGSNASLQPDLRGDLTQVAKALGTVLHFTPSNVDSMFVYSWVCSLLMGNTNIVRVASLDSEAKLLLLERLNQVLGRDEFLFIAQRNIFVSYPKASAVTRELSLNANARVIWGGDQSVADIRQIPSHPRCRDISFADRYSAALINGDALSTQAHIDELAEKLWKDTEPHQQQACSSPRLIIWYGNKDPQLALFKKLNQLAKRNAIPINQSNNFLVLSQLMQSTGRAGQIILQDAVLALMINQFNQADLHWHTGAGAFFVFNTSVDGVTDKSVDNLANVVTHKLQTLSVWGVEQTLLLKLIENPSIQGIDRVVRVGQALDFSPTWDGYDLLSELSRLVVFCK